MPLAQSFPAGVDLDFRPASYVADWCATAAAVQNIVGEERREQVHQRIAAGVLCRPVSVRLLADHLHRRTRDAWVALDPARHVSGEYLPRYLSGENEIARVVLATTPRLVYSLRASTRFLADNDSLFGNCAKEATTRFRVVDECGNDFVIPALKSVGVMSVREIVELIDSVQTPHLRDVPEHLPFPERLVWWRAQNEHHAGPLQHFVRARSVVYPQLGMFYRERIRWWVANHFASSHGRMQYADSLDRAVEAWWRLSR